jgi:hypothetical protein
VRFFAGIALAAVALSGAAAPLMSFQYAPATLSTRLPAKQVRAVKRQKVALADAPPRYRRSKNPPPKRKLKRNLVTHSRRVRRKHRRARKAA